MMINHCHVLASPQTPTVPINSTGSQIGWGAVGDIPGTSSNTWLTLLYFKVKNPVIGTGVVCVGNFKGKVNSEVLQVGEGNLRKYLWGICGSEVYLPLVCCELANCRSLGFFVIVVLFVFNFHLLLHPVETSWKEQFYLELARVPFGSLCRLLSALPSFNFMIESGEEGS